MSHDAEALRELRQRLGARIADQERAASERAAAARELGTALCRAGAFAEAEAHLRAALALGQEARGRDTGHEQVDAVPVLSTLAGCLQALGRADEALVLCERACEMAASERGADHPAVAQLLAQRAILEATLGREAAADTARQALDGLERTVGLEHPVARVVAGPLRTLAGRATPADRLDRLQVMLAMGERDQAMALARVCIDDARAAGDAVAVAAVSVIVAALERSPG